jgi:hypothetical protein
MKYILLLCLTLVLFINITYSQNTDSVMNTNVLVTNPKPIEPKNATIDTKPFITSLEFVLSISVLLFGLIIVGLEIYLIRTKEIGPDMLVKFIVVTLIITGTLFLITAGYNNNQIAPAVGLFGTVAGYLLGKSSSESNTSKNENL